MSLPQQIEFGVFTFGEVSATSNNSLITNPKARLREIIDLAKIADQAGIGVFGVGEHHRRDFAISSPPVVLSAIAEATDQIKLTSSVTVLSTSDPVKVYEDFATLDLISDGRAEITAGRGAYIESFPLFGYELSDYEELFEEKLDLLTQILRNETLEWSGKFRSALSSAGIYPRATSPDLPLWLAVGGTPASVVRAARFGLPLYFAILSNPKGFIELANLYRSALERFGTKSSQSRIGVSSHFYVEETSQGARDTFFPHYSQYIGQNMPGARRGNLPRANYESWLSPAGALMVGSPEEITEKILWEIEILGHTRFLAQIGLGGLPFKETARSIEILATDVLPQVNKFAQTKS
ncbi:MAG: LLM class flavin-dependent oxidoreductase [Actinomycetota bacterium]|nr:LLM class flavin-dependent oxidoreductase [Actinomycetota bacterium]